MSTWEALLAASLPVLGLVGAAIRWYVLFRETAEERQRVHEVAMADRFEKMQLAFLTALQVEREACARDRAEWVAENKAQRDLRLADAKGYIETTHTTTDRLAEIFRTLTSTET